MGEHRIKLLGLLVVVQLVSLEIALSLYFFQKRSEYPLAIVHYAAFALERLGARAENPSLGIFEAHPKFGYAHKPNSTGKHEAQSFRVQYTIGPAGERKMPAHPSPKGKVLFLGASFTFGYGVQDDETYPHLLSQGAWKQWRLVNKAVNGWGTVQAYQMLEQELSSSSPPDVVVYGMIPDHVCRNYLRPMWLQMMADSDRAHPHFELVDGQLEFRGIVGVDAAVQDEAIVRHRELALTEAFLEEMQRLTADRGIPFFVVLLPQKFAVACGPVDWSPSLIQAITTAGIRVVDLSELKSKIEWLNQDVHPTANGQRTLAEALAASPITQALSAATP